MIPHNQLTLGVEEEQAAMAVIRSGWLAAGRQVELFEQLFCDYVGLPHGSAVAVSSGSVALFLALHALSAKGKQIAFPAYTCSSLRHAVHLAGAEELLVDSEHGSPNISLEQLHREKYDVAIIPHMFGMPVDIKQAPSHRPIIEDCAQALGAIVRGEKVGLSGDVGVYSFFATKLMTSGGEGGMVVSRQKDYIDGIRDYLNFDQRRDQKKRFNFKMTEIQAAIGIQQLKKFPSFVQRRAELFDLYVKNGVPLLDLSSSDKVPVRFRAILQHDHPQVVINHLKQQDIHAAVPIYRDQLLGDGMSFSQAVKFAETTVSLPLYPNLTEQDVCRISELVLTV